MKRAHPVISPPAAGLPSLGVRLLCLVLGCAGTPVRAVASQLPVLIAPPVQTTDPVPAGLQAALILGAGQTGRYAAFAVEARLSAGKLRPCFDPRCAERLARKTKADAVLLTSLRRAPDGRLRLSLVLYVPAAEHLRALRRLATLDSLPAVARAAAADLTAGRNVEAEGRWEDVSWLSPRDSTHYGRFVRYGLLAALAAAGGVALAEEQQRADPVSASPLALAPDSGSESDLRGFFASPPLDARAQGLGGAGAGLMPEALAVLNNPAALGLLEHPDVVLAHSQAADGSPLLTAAFAAPTSGSWSQGVALHYAGDGLESEATLGWAGAYDAGSWTEALAGVWFGAAGKLYLAQVGEEGTGQDRARGRVTGLGLDVGAVVPLEERLKVSFMFRDLLSFLWERDDFTNGTASEVLPPEFRAAAAATAPGELRFFLEGDRGLPEAPVHIRIGAEKTLYRILAARAGFHQVFGAQSVRTLTAGFGIDTRGLRAAPALSVEFAFEYGLGDEQDLVSGQEFSLEMQF